MIPQKLELTNFLSYRQTTVLDFKDIHLACISGANGAGKSTILDAMTWALFGKSRTRSDDNIVNRTAAFQNESAEIRFQFDLEEMRYRVIRRKRTGRSTELEFQFRVAAGKWETLTEGTSRDTQTAIIDLLGMNYDTFTNASFFLQGKADEFTTKTPGKRKEILADLLGVSQWDRLRDTVAERRRAEERSLLLLDARLEDIERELQEAETRRQALAAAKADFDNIATRLESLETLLGSLRQVAEALAQQKQIAQRTQLMLTRQQTSLQRLEATYASRQQERVEMAVILAEADAIEAAQRAFESADEALQQWQERSTQFNTLQQERQPHELKLARIRSSLAQQEKTLQQRAENIQRMQFERGTLQEKKELAARQLAEQTSRLAKLAEQEQLWHDARAALQTLQGERDLQQKELTRMRAEGVRIAGLQREQVAVQKNLDQAIAALENANQKLAATAAQRQQHAAGLAERDNLNAEQPRLREEMDVLTERIKRLEEESGGFCPLCGQELSEDHRQQVLAELRADGQSRGDRYRKNQARITALVNEISALEKELNLAARLEKEQQTQQQRQASAQARLEEITRQLAAWEADGPQRIAELETLLADDRALREKQEAVAGLASLLQDKQLVEKQRQDSERELAGMAARLVEIERAITSWQEKDSVELDTVTRRLKAADFDAPAQQAIQTLDKQIAELGYDTQAHMQAKQERQRLAAGAARYQVLKQAEAAIKPLDKGLADLDQQLLEQRKEVADTSRQLAETNAQVALLSADGADLQATEAAVQTLREEKVTANRRIGAAQQQLAVLDTLREQSQQWRQDRAEQTLLIQRLERLEKACGRDGVQALLIEQALPEIEADANDLLDRLTGGDMRVTFTTQRQLKSRDALAETLDIRISDAAGERPYENYSGGEQFRVNFAVRLALSRILARRAGARLQTLVIDEGFGSQDPLGRQRLVEAINAIQGDFVRILVITHIDALRDAFPARIEVSKERAGSTIAVY